MFVSHDAVMTFSSGDLLPDDNLDINQHDIYARVPPTQMTEFGFSTVRWTVRRS